MPIKIGGKTLSTRKPHNLDELLVAATGCNAAETVGALDAYSSPARVAAAIHPFLGDDGPTVQELGASLAAQMGDHRAALLNDVRKLYGADPEPEAAVATTTKKEA